MQKNKMIDRLRKNISWYEKNTGIELDNYNDDYDLSDNKYNENDWKRIIEDLRHKNNMLAEKKEHYKTKCKIANEKLKLLIDKFNQAERLDNNNKTPKKEFRNYDYNSAKKEIDPEDEYNDFEENISIGSNN